jgi:glyoxylase-like metal-dependent hydrolase (beta-lactamase superfamily II)
MAMKGPFISEIAKDTYAVNEYGLAAMYVVIGTERALLIDTGCGLTDLPAMMEKLTDKPYDVVLTHGHLDHVGGVGCFQKIHVHHDDWEMVRSLDFERLRNYCDSLGNMGGYEAYDYTRDMVREFTEFPEFLDITDGQVFDLGGRRLTVTLIPGHTKGGLVLIDDKSRILFSGDCANVNTLLFGTSVNTALKGFLRIRALRDQYDQNFNGHLGYAGAPNCFSQPESVPEDLIHICKCILTGTDTPTMQGFLGNERAGMNYGHARLVYNREWKYDEGEEPVDLSLI